MLLCSDPTPTFSHTAPSTYTPSYDTPDTWDCITVVSDFPNIVPAHPLDILPHVAPEPVTLHSLMHSWPYTTHHFTEFTLDALTEIPQSFGSLLEATLLTPIP